MKSLPLGSTGFSWRRLTRLDRVALGVVLLYVVVRAAMLFRPDMPLAGFVRFLFFLSLGYFAVRLVAWTRTRMLWSLRNRLIVAYVFIAVVPILLLLVMAALAASILYSQLGAYLLYADLQSRVEEAADAAAAIAASADPQAASVHTHWDNELPGLKIDLNRGRELLDRLGGPRAKRFAGIVQDSDKLSLLAMALRPDGTVVTVEAPVSPELLDRVAPDLGPLQVLVTLPSEKEAPRVVTYRIGDRVFQQAARTRQRALQAAANWLDRTVDGVARFEALPLHAEAGDAGTRPVFAFFSARPSQLNRRLFSALGELGGVYFQLLVLVGVVFIVIEAAALIIGIVLTRTITQAVDDLYRATQHVQTGDLSYRIRVQKRDQLAALGESFNSMTNSISSLIEEQRQRQRLENELSIAREVQDQLFPQSLPSMPGIEVEAICRAARMVSGDYYDFLRVGPTQLGMALADISGKGISAALLMASLQAALRSQAVLDGAASLEPAALVTRLNLHLFLNTSEDRYATFFYAVYDTAKRTLRYTNAGHLPPLYIVGERVQQLEEGGMVVGLFDDCTFTQGTIQVEPGSVLVVYSDGLVEPENVYGEEFGRRRLREVALRNRDRTPHALVEALMTAAEEWAGSQERADDMTVIVARME